jgi:glycogen synthase
MRILVLAWEYPPHVVGGMGRHVTELAAALAGRGFDIQIVTPQLRGGLMEEQTSAGVRIARVPVPPSEGQEFITFVKQANAAIERAAQLIGPCDLVHAHDWLVADAAVALKHAWRCPLVTTVHATERGRQQGYLSTSLSDQINAIEWRLAYESWRVIACSRFMADQITSYFGTPEQKIDVIPNGVRMQLSPFRTGQERAVFRRRFAINGAPLVFYVGRIVYEKGVHVLIDAWPLVLRAEPDACLVIAGTGSELERLRQRISELGLSGSITLMGFVSDEERERLYRVADVAAFPSLYEPFGIVALEAMAAGCPVVVASTGGLAEVVRLHETGVTVYPNNAESLAWGILHTLQHRDWTQARVANALQEVQELYEWATVAEATAAVYERTLADWRRAQWGDASEPQASGSSDGSNP